MATELVETQLIASVHPPFISVNESLNWMNPPFISVNESLNWMNPPFISVNESLIPVDNKL
ncbi:hypothetical protein [Nostoc sp. UHCC 0302]|uniref:hypothetical protein n=1 Tax=Nostoc sp. UHCC 0302 TaxID=3134896 RepID=UPI00311CBE70